MDAKKLAVARSAIDAGQSAEDVAVMLGVGRVTLYRHLNSGGQYDDQPQAGQAPRR